MLDSLNKVGRETEVFMKYTPERREAILRKLLLPNNRPVVEVVRCVAVPVHGLNYRSYHLIFS
jgi:MoaA/NifB/PqqE/SkfB family radical SAM enzyme